MLVLNLQVQDLSIRNSRNKTLGLRDLNCININAAFKVLIKSFYKDDLKFVEAEIILSTQKMLASDQHDRLKSVSFSFLYNNILFAITNKKSIYLKK